MTAKGDPVRILREDDILPYGHSCIFGVLVGATIGRPHFEQKKNRCLRTCFLFINIQYSNP
jgi:hypothetical protein